MSTGRRSGLLLLALGACAPGRAVPSSAAAAPDVAPEVPGAAPLPFAPATVSAPPPPSPAPPVAAEPEGASAARPDAIDAAAWASERGAAERDPLLDRLGSCTAIRAGDPPRDALLCEGGPPMFQTNGGESVFPFLVVDVDRGRLRTLLEAPLFAGALDFPGEEYVRLSVALAGDGRRFTVAERPERTCPAARAHARGLFRSAEDAAGLRDWLVAIDRACAGVGLYTWRGGRFVKGR